MDSQAKFLQKLSILRDDPLFWGSEKFDPGQDAFNHEAYAKAIFDILSENSPPMSIGLFGPWGIGKSTIISILFKLITQSTSTLKPVYFNAWKYSGDAFRRQFLIEVAKQVYQSHSDRDAVVLRLEQLNYTEVLRETVTTNLVAKIKDIIKLKGMAFKSAGLARLLFAGIVFVIGIVLSLFAKSFYPLIAGLLSAVTAFLMGLKFEDVFVVQETSVYDPKLIFPEQFEAEFRKLIGPSGPLGSSKPVIVIDDIDRCEAGTIRDILVSVKTFLGQEHCFFLVPCDDRSIVQVFDDPSQRKGYQDELLRKYFNVGIRIAPLMATDLVDFANTVSKRTEMPASVVQMAILANYRDARKMKHFLNTFSVKYAIAKARKSSGFMPVDIDQNLAGFAKAVLMEDLFPALFSKMVEHPEIYEVLESAALTGKATPDIKRLELENWEESYPGLRAILEKTRDIKIQHLAVFLSLKTTNPEARIPRGFELKNSIVQGDETGTEEILKVILTAEARSSLAQLLIDLLDNTSDTFLKNTITSTIRWCCRDNLFPEVDRANIASKV
ncbi:MAG TPA: P-loop NTPase fold protein, partial [Candidatus Acidoferrum sp.]